MPDLDLDPILLLPLALVLLLMALPVLSRRIWGRVEHIQPLHVYQKMSQPGSVVLFDLRDARAYDADRIEGARHVTTEALERAVTEHSAGGPPIVLVCQSDLSSTRQAARLGKAGYGNVLVMKGGMHAWKRAKLPTTAS